MTPLLTARDVAGLPHLHLNTVKRIKPEALPYFRITPRGDRRYRPEDVTAYLERLR